MQTCFRAHPDVYPEELGDPGPEDEIELERPVGDGVEGTVVQKEEALNKGGESTEGKAMVSKEDPKAKNTPITTTEKTEGAGNAIQKA